MIREVIINKKDYYPPEEMARILTGKSLEEVSKYAIRIATK